MNGFSEYENQVRRRVDELESEVARLKRVVTEKEFMESVLRQENALQADVVEGFLTSRVHIAFDVTREQHLLGVMLSEESILLDRTVAHSIGQRVAVQLSRYIQGLIDQQKPPALKEIPWLDQNAD